MKLRQIQFCAPSGQDDHQPVTGPCAKQFRVVAQASPEHRCLLSFNDHGVCGSVGLCVCVCVGVSVSLSVSMFI